ncbi:uncharacterized protein LOC128343059 isoform X2 [Hemicordylus capensis]|uniref:uncharacterized protein LOC128343059 isoform X2 n=1 Tax=Hemicordylus capensis TaxID=884348 RepID=UPI00230259F4|nr:uncharacterized protein LOC128343059 isoform X2 [Hemicordylus capensis]
MALQVSSVTAEDAVDFQQPPKTRAKYWSESETGVLVDLWVSEQVQAALQHQYHNETIYKWISKEMTKRGYNRSGAQCKERVNLLKKKFKQLVAHNRCLGVEPRTMPHYKKLAAVLLNRRGVALSHTAGSSLPITDQRQGANKMAVPSTSKVAVLAPVASTSSASPFPVLGHVASQEALEPSRLTPLTSKRPPQQLLTGARVEHVGVSQERPGIPLASQAQPRKHLEATARGLLSASTVANGKEALRLGSGLPHTQLKHVHPVEVCLVDEHGQTTESAMYSPVPKGEIEEEELLVEVIHVNMDPAIVEEVIQSLEEPGEPLGGIHEAIDPQSSMESSLQPQSEELFSPIPAHLLQSLGSDSVFDDFPSSSIDKDSGGEVLGADSNTSLSEGLEGEYVDEQPDGEANVDMVGDEPTALDPPEIPPQGLEGQVPPEVVGGGAERRPLTNAQRAARFRNRKRTEKVLLAKEFVRETARTREKICELLRELDRNEHQRRLDDRRVLVWVSDQTARAMHKITRESTSSICNTLRECIRESDAAFERGMEAHTAQLKRIANLMSARLSQQPMAPPPPQVYPHPYFIQQPMMPAPFPSQLEREDAAATEMEVPKATGQSAGQSPATHTLKRKKPSSTSVTPSQSPVQQLHSVVVKLEEESEVSGSETEE